MFIKSAAQRVMRNRWLFATLLAFACSLCALIGGTILFVQQAASTLQHIERQADLSVRLRELQALQINLIDAETGQRGYLLTGQPRYLQPYQQAVAAMPSLLNQLDGIKLADPSLAAKIGLTRHLVEQKLASLAQTVRLRDAGQADAAEMAPLIDRGQVLKEQAREAMNNLLAMVRVERNLLAESVAAGEARSRRLLVITVSLLGVFVTLAGVQIALLARAGARSIAERTAAVRALRELTEIIEHTPDYVMQADARGAIQYLNPSIRRALGLKPDAAVEGFAFDDFHTPETSEKFASEIVPAVDATGVWTGEATVYLQGKDVIPVSHVVIGHRNGAGNVVRYSAVMRDISAEAQARERLQNQTATLQSVTEAIPAMVAVNGADERYRFVNRSFERWFGKSREAMVGRTTLELLGPSEYERSRPWITKVLAGETISFEKEFTDRHPPVHIAVSFIPLRLDNGALDGYVTVAQDVTHHRQEAVRLLHLSERDALTGLLNRRGFESFLEQAIQSGGAASLALLYVDLDRFKPVNDLHGHPVGDQLLREFGHRLRQLVRPTDAVARLGGDEFAIVLCGVPTQHQCGVVAEKILAAANTPFDVDGLQLHIGASVGIAFDASNDEGAAGLVRIADAKLYQAKASGRGKWA